MSNYTYADGAIHNDHHKEMTINVSGKTDIAALMKAFMADDAEVMEEVQETAQPVCPTELQTQEAEKLFEKLREAGMVNARMQPLNLSNAEKGMLAFELAGRLDIPNQWQVFATLWGTTPGALRSAYNRAIEQQKTMLFIEKLKNILS
jgi:hypothetical protein